MVIELLANVRKKDKTKNGGLVDTAIAVSSLGSTDIFALETPYDAVIAKESWAHFHYIIRQTTEPLPESVWLSVTKTTLPNDDDIEIVIDPAIYEADIDKEAAVGISELELDISSISAGDISGSFWLRRRSKNTSQDTPSSLGVTIKFNTK
jgi:hypothetical protein